MLSETETEIQENPPESDEIIKADQVKTATHCDILSLGNFLFEEASEKQREVFEQRLLQHEQNVIIRCRKQHEEDIKQIQNEHQLNIKKIQKKAKQEQNKALQDEASRIREIMDKAAEKLVEGAVADGQKRLDDALRLAREQFDVETVKTIDATIKEQQQITDGLLIEQEEKNKEKIEELNNEWEVKMQELKAENSVALKEMLAGQQRILRDEFNTELAAALLEAQLKHDEEKRVLNDEITAMKNENETLQATLSASEEKSHALKERMKDLMTSFQKFIETSNGFEEGQADFLLTNIIPENLDEFLTV